MFAVNNNNIFTYDILTLTEKCGSAVNAILASIFLRYSKGTEDLDKIKSGKMEEVISDLITSDKVTYADVYKARNFLKKHNHGDFLLHKIFYDKNGDYLLPVIDYMYIADEE